MAQEGHLDLGLIGLGEASRALDQASQQNSRDEGEPKDWIPAEFAQEWSGLDLHKDSFCFQQRISKTIQQEDHQKGASARKLHRIISRGPIDPKLHKHQINGRIDSAVGPKVEFRTL